MKLARYYDNGAARVGAVIGDAITPLNGLGFDTMLEIIMTGPKALDKINDHTAKATPEIPLAEAKLLAPVETPSKYLAIGLNYATHVAEADRLGVSYSDNNAQQIWFNKQTTCLNGPYDDINPGVTEKLDYEVELGVVIGKTAKSVSHEDAPKHVFGYCVANDVSARDWQFHSSTTTMGKSFDTHGPIGPWIVTADEIDDPHQLALRAFVNGEKRQESNTRFMIHNIWKQIEYLTTAFTLLPGDLIATGTPEGVGIGMEPPVFLQPGDVVRCEIEGVGAIENKVARA